MTEQTHWLRYFDKSKTRNQGRKLPLETAIENPTLTEIATAVKQIGYEYTIESNKSHPKEHHLKTGRILVHTTDKKNDVLHAIAAYIPVLRENKQQTKHKNQ